jgi:hypothetical protein
MPPTTARTPSSAAAAHTSKRKKFALARTVPSERSSRRLRPSKSLQRISLLAFLLLFAHYSQASPGSPTDKRSKSNVIPCWTVTFRTRGIAANGCFRDRDRSHNPWRPDHDHFSEQAASRRPCPWRRTWQRSIGQQAGNGAPEPRGCAGVVKGGSAYRFEVIVGHGLPLRRPRPTHERVREFREFSNRKGSCARAGACRIYLGRLARTARKAWQL